jgi:hypothetical protein
MSKQVNPHNLELFQDLTESQQEQVSGGFGIAAPFPGILIAQISNVQSSIQTQAVISDGQSQAYLNQTAFSSSFTANFVYLPFRRGAIKNPH